MSLRKINKNISVALVANFVVAGIGTSNSVFADQKENLNEYSKKVESALSDREETNRIDESGEKTSEFEEKEKFVRALLSREDGLELGAKDLKTQLTVTYFYGMLCERINSSKDSKKQMEDLYKLKKEVELYLNALYKRKIELEEKEKKERQKSKFSFLSWIAYFFGRKSEEKGSSEELGGSKEPGKA